MRWFRACNALFSGMLFAATTGKKEHRFADRPRYQLLVASGILQERVAAICGLFPGLQMMTALAQWRNGNNDRITWLMPL